MTYLVVVALASHGQLTTSEDDAVAAVGIALTPDKVTLVVIMENNKNVVDKVVQIDGTNEYQLLMHQLFTESPQYIERGYAPIKLWEAQGKPGAEPQAIFTVVLSQVKEAAEKKFHKRLSLGSISCPDYFNMTLRIVVKNANDAAGLGRHMPLGLSFCAAMGYHLDQAPTYVDSEEYSLIVNLNIASLSMMLLAFGHLDWFLQLHYVEYPECAGLNIASPRVPPSELSSLTSKLQAAVGDFLDRFTTPDDVLSESGYEPPRKDLKNIVISGDASEEAMFALRDVLMSTFSKVNDTIHPKMISAYGAALRSVYLHRSETRVTFVHDEL